MMWCVSFVLFCFACNDAFFDLISGNNVHVGLTSLYFVVTGIQFWGASYMIAVLDVPRSYVDASFVVCASTAPTSGVFFGAWLIDMLGGYHGPQQRVLTLKLCTVNCTL